MYTEKIRIVVRFDASDVWNTSSLNGKFYDIHEVTTDGSYDAVQRAANKIINDSFKPGDDLWRYLGGRRFRAGTVLTSHWEYV
jgi:hypothetical protein